MNWYKHYIGDFQRDTNHLTLTERGAYLALIQHYYATESHLPNDHAMLCRISGAMTKPERDAVRVAMGFFAVKAEGLWHKRIEAELEKTEGKRDVNKKIALEREARKRAENIAAQQKDTTKRTRNVHETLHENSTIPDTRHQTPEKESTKDKTLPAVAGCIVKENTALSLLMTVPDINEQVAKDWLKVRKAKRAPLTATALAMIECEAEKAGITTAQAIAIATARGWQSFKAEWITSDNQKTNAERTQDYKDAQAAKFYSPLLTMTDDEKREWGFTV